MDNKKWYKKFATIFWWILTALPLIIALIYFIGYHFAFNNGMATAQELANYHSSSTGDFSNIFMNSMDYFEYYSIGSITTTFQGLFEILGVENYLDFGYMFGFMLSVQVYHLLFDCLVFFIHLIHNFMDKFNNEMY